MDLLFELESALNSALVKKLEEEGDKCVTPYTKVFLVAKELAVDRLVKSLVSKALEEE